MPNGTDLTPEEFNNLQDAFAPIDTECERFAPRTRAEYSHVSHGMPYRRFQHGGADGITRCIDIAPIVYVREIDKEAGALAFVKRQVPHFLFGMAAWKDEDMRRRSWHREFDRRITLPEPHELNVLLQQMWELVSLIGESDLR